MCFQKILIPAYIRVFWFFLVLLWKRKGRGRWTNTKEDCKKLLGIHFLISEKNKEEYQGKFQQTNKTLQEC